MDNLLRFRPGESAVSIVAKGAAGLVWSAVSYVVRIYLNLLVEPQVNPVKHFPVVTVSHKIILPMSVTLTKFLRAPLMPLGPVVANALAVSTVFLLPGVFGFLVWELKENWRLYRANRPRTLRPVVVGGHGETVPRLLRPGFHSGTVPKLFAKLRRARRGERRAVAKHEAALRHVEEAVRRFVERDFLALAGGALSDVRVSPTRIAVDVRDGERVVELAFEEASGRLMARGPEAFGDLWRMAGADLSATALAERLGTDRYDVSEEGLVVWRDGAEIVYPLSRALDVLRPRGPGPELRADEVFLRPIAWEEWEGRSGGRAPPSARWIRNPVAISASARRSTGSSRPRPPAT
ncbi:MAG: hypothetical protein HYY17_06690 [Planctomycetes bacterium]|nr:hypothetical protein [Planctomycetota bacterium]